MKKSGFLLLVLLSLAVSSYGQSHTSVALLAGYSMSAFEGQEDAAGTIPLGAQLGYMIGPSVELGLEGNYLLGGLTWKGESERYSLETTFNQVIAGVYAKIFLGQGNIKPFVKGGPAYFMGNLDVKAEYDGEEYKDSVKIDPAIGFVVGGGLTLSKKLFLEFNYNLVSRKEESTLEEDMNKSEKAGMNTWSVLLGYKLHL